MVQDPRSTKSAGGSAPLDGDRDTEDLEAVADRLEAALDAIARRLAAGEGAAAVAPTGGPSPELARRLDSLIARVREALDGTAHSGTTQIGTSE